MHVQVVDPSAFTRAYDHALCSALASAGAEVELITSRLGYGEAPAADGYAVAETFYRRGLGPPGSRLRTATKLLGHVPDMLRYRPLAQQADVVHFQWLPVQWLDRHLLPRRPVVLTAHDLLPREPRPGQTQAQRRLYEAVDAVIVHSQYGRSQLVGRLGIPEAKVHVIHHGAFTHLSSQSDGPGLPRELDAVQAPVVLFFGLLRPYKGLEGLLAAWRGIPDAELWVVGRPRMPIEPLRRAAGAGVRFVPRFISDEEIPAFFRRADLIVLPYARTERFDASGVLATALAFAKPTILSDVGSFGEVAGVGAAELVPADDATALRERIVALLGDPSRRRELAEGARAAAEGPYSWQRAAARSLEVYRSLV